MSRTWSYGLHAVAGAGVPVPEVMMGEAGRQGLCSSACVCGTRSAVRLGIWNERRTNHVACHHRWKQNRRLRLLLRRRRLQHLCLGCLILRLRLRRAQIPNPNPHSINHSRFQSRTAWNEPGLCETRASAAAACLGCCDVGSRPGRREQRTSRQPAIPAVYKL